MGGCPEHRILGFFPTYFRPILGFFLKKSHYFLNNFNHFFAFLYLVCTFLPKLDANSKSRSGTSRKVGQSWVEDIDSRHSSIVSARLSQNYGEKLGGCRWILLIWRKKRKKLGWVSKNLAEKIQKKEKIWGVGIIFDWFRKTDHTCPGFFPDPPLIDPSFIMFRRPLYKETHFDGCRQPRKCLRQHFRILAFLRQHFAYVSIDVLD